MFIGSKKKKKKSRFLLEIPSYKSLYPPIMSFPKSLLEKPEQRGGKSEYKECAQILQRNTKKYLENMTY